MQECLEDRNIGVDKLWAFLSGLPCCVDRNLMLLSAKKNEFERAASMTAIFIILKTECSSFLNYHIFESILAGFGIGDMHEDLKYPEMLKCYIKKHKVSEFIEVHPQLNKFSDATKELVIILNIEAICRVCAIMDLGEDVANVMKLEPHSLLIHEIKEACVVITFLIPAQVADVLFMGSVADVFSPEQEKQFRELSVKVLICNGYEFDFTLNDDFQEEHREEEEVVSELREEAVEEEIDITPGILHVMHNVVH